MRDPKLAHILVGYIGYKGVESNCLNIPDNLNLYFSLYIRIHYIIGIASRSDTCLIKTQKTHLNPIRAFHGNIGFF